MATALADKRNHAERGQNGSLPGVPGNRAASGYGAPAGNQNARKHGLCARLAVGKLPPGQSYLAKLVHAYRRELEQRALDELGEVDIVTAGILQTCVAWHAYALQSRDWLRKSHDQLSPAERLHFARESAKGFSERDRHIKLLGLKTDRTKEDPIASLYAKPANGWANHDATEAPGRTQGDRMASGSSEPASASETQREATKRAS